MELAFRYNCVHFVIVIVCQKFFIVVSCRGILNWQSRAERQNTFDWLYILPVRVIISQYKSYAVAKVPSRRYYSCEIKVPSRRHLIKKSAVPARRHCSCKVVVLSRPQSNYISTVPSRRHRSLKDYEGSSFDIEI